MEPPVTSAATKLSVGRPTPHRHPRILKSNAPLIDVFLPVGPLLFLFFFPGRGRVPSSTVRSKQTEIELKNCQGVCLIFFCFLSAASLARFAGRGVRCDCFLSPVNRTHVHYTTDHWGGTRSTRPSPPNPKPTISPFYTRSPPFRTEHTQPNAPAAAPAAPFLMRLLPLLLAGRRRSRQPPHALGLDGEAAGGVGGVGGGEEEAHLPDEVAPCVVWFWFMRGVVSRTGGRWSLPPASTAPSIPPSTHSTPHACIHLHPPIHPPTPGPRPVPAREEEAGVHAVGPREPQRGLHRRVLVVAVGEGGGGGRRVVGGVAEVGGHLFCCL